MRDRRLVRFAAALLALTSAALCAPAAPAAARDADVARYRSMVEHLAAPEMAGRGPGTKGLDRARDWLVEQFRSIGLRPAFGGSFTQALRARTGVAVERQRLALVGSRPERAVEALRPGEDFRAMGLSASKAFEGEAVFVGYSISDRGRRHDSYAGAASDALRGKVAVVLRYEPQDAKGVSLWTKRRGSWTRASGLASKAALAARRGAAGVLIVNPPAHDRPLDPTARTAMGPRAPVPVVHLSRKAWGRILSAAGREPKAAAGKLRAAADAGTGGLVPLGVPLRGQVRLKAATATIHNVAGVLPGRGALAEQHVVIGAHYDHLGRTFDRRAPRAGKPVIHPGADDNASGTAGVVTLARWFARRARSGAKARLPGSRRSILFVAFTGEERGLLGSRHLATHLADAGLDAGQVAAMINMDMIGRLRQGRLNVWGVDSGDRWREIVAAAAEGTKLKLRLSGPGFGPSDHASFYRAKVPVLCFNTGIHADLHRPTDTADKINAAGAIEVLRLVASVARAVTTDAKAPAYVAPKPGRRTGFLGIVPDVAAEGEAGCPVRSVVAGGPAARAGLKPGDVIVALNGRKIAGPADLLVLLGHTQPEAVVKLAIRRDGKRIELTVKLGGR